MARSPDVLEDPTPLDSPRVDVRVRVAWLLRMSRAAGVDGEAPSVTEMARRLKDQGISALRAVGVGLGDRPGRPRHGGPRGLRGRAGPRARHPARRRRPGPPHLRPRPARGRRPAPELVDLDRATDRVLGRPAGPPAWTGCTSARQRWRCRPGLPGRLLRPAGGPAPQRGQPLGLHGVPHPLRGARAAPLRPVRRAGARRRSATTSTSPATRSSPRPWAWSPSAPTGRCLRLLVPHLASEDPVVMRGAVIGLQNLAAIAGGLAPADWDRVVAPFVRRVQRATPTTRARRAAAVEAVARPAVLRADALPGQRLVPPRGPRHRPRGSPARRDAPARPSAPVSPTEVCDDAGVQHQPLLARLLFEAAFDPRGDRSWTSHRCC